MTRATLSTRPAVAALLCVSLLTVGIALPLRADTPTLGAATPEALIARVEAAVEAGDFGEIAACMAPEERAKLTAGLLIAASMMAAFAQMGGEMAGQMAEGMSDEDKAEAEKQKQEAAAEGAKMQKKIEEIFKKHGLDENFGEEVVAQVGSDQPGSATELFKDVDQVALVRDLMGFLTEMGEVSGSDEAKEKLGGEITDLEVEGDTATARRGDESVELVRLDGRWYLKPEM